MLPYADTLTEKEKKELQDFVGTLRRTNENIQEYLIQGSEEYYAFLLRAYVVMYTLIASLIDCSVAPKWFKRTKIRIIAHLIFNKSSYIKK